MPVLAVDRRGLAGPVDWLQSSVLYVSSIGLPSLFFGFIGSQDGTGAGRESYAGTMQPNDNSCSYDD